MINPFSIRHNIIKQKSLDIKEIPLSLRNRLWNCIKKYLRSMTDDKRDKLIEFLWDTFFKKDIDDLWHIKNYSNEPYDLNQIKEEFYNLEWNWVYDYIEVIIKKANSDEGLIFELNKIFLEEAVPYRIVDKQVVNLISPIEISEVEKAVNTKYLPVTEHISKALELYHKRPKADYLNSIKESISSIEALSRLILKKPNATLGELADKLNIHPAFRKAIKELYGWTSDDSGIRHSNKELDFDLSENEARYMLVQCSALVNYIMSKNEN